MPLLRGVARPRRGASCVVWSSSALFARGGHSEDARNLILALDWVGIPLYAHPTGWTWSTELPAQVAGRLNALIPISLPDRFVHVMQTDPPAFRRHPRAIRHIGRAVAETETAPARWVSPCETVDELWVPSRFAVGAFVRAGVPAEKVFLVPECIQVELYDPAVPPLDLAGLGVSGFVFLSVIGWTRRKGWDVLVRAFVEEFGRDEAVTLLLKVNPYFGKSVEQGVAELQAFLQDRLGRDPRKSAPVVVADIDPGAEGMARLYRAANAFVMASRGEGWGRPYMEAMAMGLPTIGTRWGGNLDFMTDENSYLIDSEVVEVGEEALRERPALRGHWWAEPSVAHLRNLMRRTVERPEEATFKGARAREDILATCNWEQAATAILERLEEGGHFRRLEHVTRAPGPADAEPAQHAAGRGSTARRPRGRERVEGALGYARIAAWEPWLVECVPASGRVALDVGANVGTYALDLAQTFQEVHAFEPNPLALRGLAIQAANRPNLRVWPCAVGGAMGDLRLRVYRHHSLTSACDIAHLDIDRGEPAGAMSVPLVSLDGLGFSGRPVDFLKVDVEGYEVEVLRGAREMVSRNRPRLLIEVHSQENLSAIREILGPLYDLVVIPHPFDRAAGATCWLAGVVAAG